MKVFLSWSGHRSHQVALALRDWLPSVIQSITPYVSSEDIDKGARWSTDIAKELEDSTFGILCVTKDNLEAPWLLFEAGALSKMMDKSSVCPFIFDLKRSEVKGPILQFQSTIFEKEDVRKLLSTLNKTCGDTGLKEDLLNKTFDVWWPKLNEALESILGEEEAPIDTDHAQDRSLNMVMLEEILELSRTNQKILRSPDVILPPDYLEYIFRERLNSRLSDKDRNLIEEQHRLSIDIKHKYLQLMDMLDIYRNDGRYIDEDLNMNIRGFMDLVRHQQVLLERLYRTYRR